MKDIVLASASERRKDLLNKIHLPFRVQPSTADESFKAGLAPSEIVRQLALKKATEVAGGLTNALVIGADTIVVFEDRVLEKPATPGEAGQMLQSLSGNTHQVFTGVALYKTHTNNTKEDITTFVEKTNVTFGNPDPRFVRAYISGGSPMDKAGGYGIQDDFGALFVKKIDGDYYNVVGFPLFAFYKRLSSFAPEYLQLIDP